MKLPPRTTRQRLNRAFRIGASAAVGALLLSGPIGCGRKATSARPTGLKASEQHDASFAMPLKQQVRWSYAAETSPPLAKKPAYLLKTIGFAKASNAIDREAHSVMRDVATLMQSRPKIRVLFLGLTDSGPEKLNDEDLGLKRATAARETLIGLGVAKERTERATFGCRAATGDPSDPIAQEKDRRVEVWLIEE